MKMKMMIKFVAPGNPEYRCLHTNFRLSADKDQHFLLPLRTKSEPFLEHIGEKGQALVRELNKVDGITAVTLRLYEVVIQVAECFNAEEVSRQVVAAIQKIFDPEQSAEVVGFTADRT